MPPLPAEVRASSKRIREGLQQAVDFDITPQKNEIKALIVERFDKFHAERNAATTHSPASADVSMTNGHAEPAPATAQRHESKKSSHPQVGDKRKSDSDKDEELSDVPVTPPQKKKRKPDVDEDAVFAAKLQAEENSRARPTRGGAVRKPPVVKKKKTPKKKTSDKIKPEDDSDLDGSGSAAERKVNRSGGFHKLMTLSAPLSALLGGEPQLSRPQTVKRIWAHIKANDLQDPKDKRVIRCDEPMRAVFKTDKVQMFAMNKILSTQMYDPEA